MGRSENKRGKYNHFFKMIDCVVNKKIKAASIKVLKDKTVCSFLCF